MAVEHHAGFGRATAVRDREARCRPARGFRAAAAFRPRRGCSGQAAGKPRMRPDEPQGLRRGVASCRALRRNPARVRFSRRRRRHRRGKRASPEAHSDRFASSRPADVTEHDALGAWSRWRSRARALPRGPVACRVRSTESSLARAAAMLRRPAAASARRATACRNAERAQAQHGRGALQRARPPASAGPSPGRAVARTASRSRASSSSSRWAC